ncbi:hypothetical protein D3C73_998130 [compost metagenome]
MDKQIAFMNRFDPLDNPVRRNILQQVTARPIPERFDNVFVIVEGRQHQHRDTREGFLDEFGTLDTVAVRHPDIHQHHIGMRQLLQQGQSFTAIAGGARYLNLRVECYQYLKAFADK